MSRSTPFSSQPHPADTPATGAPRADDHESAAEHLIEVERYMAELLQRAQGKQAAGGLPGDDERGSAGLCEAPGEASLDAQPAEPVTPAAFERPVHLEKLDDRLAMRELANRHAQQVIAAYWQRTTARQALTRLVFALLALGLAFVLLKTARGSIGLSIALAGALVLAAWWSVSFLRATARPAVPRTPPESSEPSVAA